MYADIYMYAHLYQDSLVSKVVGVTQPEDRKDQ